MTGYGLQDSCGGCGMWKHASRSPQYRLRQNGYIGASWWEDVVSTLISFTYMSGDCVPLKTKKKEEDASTTHLGVVCLSCCSRAIGHLGFL